MYRSSLKLSRHTCLLYTSDPSITVNIIRDGKFVEKRTLKLPERIRGVLKCKNPRCITSVEQELPQEFVLTDREKRVYRCRYCETQAGK